jgi:hypothetical protein
MSRSKRESDEESSLVDGRCFDLGSKFVDRSEESPFVFFSFSWIDDMISFVFQKPVSLQLSFHLADLRLLGRSKSINTNQ